MQKRKRFQDDARREKPANAPFPLWKLPLILLLPLGALWPTVCGAHPEQVERLYSGGVYPSIKDALSSVTARVPFSIAELVLYAAVIWALATVLFHLVAWLAHRITGRRVLSALLSVAIAAGVIWNLFYFTWGFSYFRTPLKTRMGLSVCARPVHELESLAYSLSGQAGALRETLEADSRGVFTLSGDRQAVLDGLSDAYDALAREEPVFSGRTTRAKRVLWSEGLSWSGIAGVYIGLTAEPNINAAQPDLLLAQSAAHEMAHQLGIASEDEAEFAAYLACAHSPDVRVRYSGTMGALLRVANALKKADPARYRALAETYTDAMWTDLRDYNRYWERYDGPVEETVDAVNDRYLKHNAQESGVESYGESVDLLLAHHDLTKN